MVVTGVRLHSRPKVIPDAPPSQGQVVFIARGKEVVWKEREAWLARIHRVVSTWFEQ